jgi:uncharacterized protein
MNRKMDRRDVLTDGINGAVATASVVGGTTATAMAQPDAGSAISVVRNVMVPMRDGVRLATDIYLPAGDTGTTPRAVVVARTPYGKGGMGAAAALAQAARGYIVVVQDKRGRYDSEGTYRSGHDDGIGPHKDGFDTIEWIARQPWCNGRIGMSGVSYSGHTTIQAAMAAPPHLLAALAAQPATDGFDNGGFLDGVFAVSAAGGWNELDNAGVAYVRAFTDTARRDQALQELEELKAAGHKGYHHLPITEVPYQRFLTGLWVEPLMHRDDPSYFENTTTPEGMNGVRAPVLQVGGWYDVFLRNNLRQHLYARDGAATAQARQEQKLLIGPWLHGGFGAEAIGDVEFPGGAISYMDVVVDWNDHWLRGAPLKPYLQHPVVLYVMGENRWRADEMWPRADAVETPLYLHANGRLAFDRPGDEAPDTYEYDPRVPYEAPSVIDGPGDHRAFHKESNDKGSNLLVYTTPVLDEDIEIAGPLRFSLYAASSGTDTDWLVELHDVHPDGRVTILSEGITRARYRKSRTKPEALTPGQVERYDIDVRAVANVFKKGHAIRVVLTSGKDWRFERNPNAFINLNTYTDKDIRVAHQTVHHDAARPSAMILFVVPKGAVRRWIENPAPPGAQSDAPKSVELQPEGLPVRP